MSNLHRLIRSSPYYFREDEFVYDFDAALLMTDDVQNDDQLYNADIDIDYYHHVLYGLSSDLQASFLAKNNIDNCVCKDFFVQSTILPPENYIVKANTPQPTTNFFLVIDHCEIV